MNREQRREENREQDRDTNDQAGEQDRRPQSADEGEEVEAPESAGGGAQAEHTHEGDVMGSLRRERDDLEQRLLRTAADFQNYVKRAEQNVETAREQQLIDVAKGLITVLDHFDRALSVDPERTGARDVLAGVQMVHEELLSMLRRFGIERLEVQPGEAFDPNRHEAMMRENREDIDSNHVTQQLQPGYIIDDKVIRPAQVSVAE